MCRPGAMMLLLILALLGSSPCWADHISEIYGNQRGKHFCTSDYNEKPVKGIRVSTNGLGMISNIQVKLGDSWDEEHGARGRKKQEFILRPNEYITEAHGSYLARLRSLILCTNLGRCASFGRSVGQEFSAFPREDGEMLLGLCGLFDLISIKGIAFKWGYEYVNTTAMP